MIVGIIGGGQLGQMLAISAKKKGFDVICLDPYEKCPCSSVADEMIISEFDNFEKIKELCEKSDVVTYEFENIPFQIIKTLEEDFNIPQGHRPLYISQHRFREKSAANKCGLKTVTYRLVKNKEDLIDALFDLGYPCLLKTCSFGYDGKGQKKINDDSDLSSALKLVEGTECILEGFMDFEAEISVIAVRNINGEIAILPAPENHHVNNILHMSVLPNTQSELVNTLAASEVRAFIQKMDFVGIITVELFVKNNKVYFNEMAPRPHNSGHYSIEGCELNQFDLALDSITNQKVDYQDLLQPTIMVNILGQHMKKIKHFKSSDAFLHLYGKTDPKINRKMGHITFINKTKEEVKKIMKEYLED